VTKDPFDWEEWKNELEGVWRHIPKPYRAEQSIRRTLQCHLYGKLKQLGLRVVADFKPPRMEKRPVDLIALDQDGRIACAICFDTLVSLYAVKSLDSFDSARKVIFTTGHLEKKVLESRFFLKPDVDHVHLKPFGDLSL
jgi:hypothetical protein